MPLIIEFISRYWRVILIGLIVSIAFGYRMAYKSAVQELALFKQEVAVLAAKQEAKNAFELQARENITTNVVTRFNQSKKSLKAHYENPNNPKFISISMFKPASNDCSPMPATDEGSSGTGETSSGVTEVAAFDLELAGEEVLQCQSLIEWVTEQDAVVK